jgi:fatty-acyl-CoA synthase
VTTPIQVSPARAESRRAALTHADWTPSDADAILETTVGGILRAAAAAAPAAPALIEWTPTPGERCVWTHAELLRDAERTARALLQHFRPGEHVAVYAANRSEWLMLEFGAALAGLVLVTVNPAYRVAELEYVLRQSRSVGVFYADTVRGNPLARWVDEVRSGLPALRLACPLSQWTQFLDGGQSQAALPDVQPGDPAQIQYTSGTTGSPKGALLHHRGLTNNARLFAERSDLRAGDVFAHAMPFFHTTGCAMIALGSVQQRATHAFLPGYDPARLLDLLETERATHVLGVPTMLIGLLERPDLDARDLTRLRVAVCGGASVPPDVVRSIEQRCGVQFSIVYGQTECSPLITQVQLTDGDDDKANTVGPPVPGVEVRILDPVSGAVQPVGVVGELCTRGYHVMHEYFDKPEATASALDREGWLHTGDLGTMDARGYCRITGRLKDMVIRGGENMFPAEIEAALHQHPSVVDVAVIGVADPRMGEELAAFVRVRGLRPAADELHAHVRSMLAAPKAPRYWVFVDDFPLTGSGKVQKFVLRERWAEGTVDAVDLAATRKAPSG